MEHVVWTDDRLAERFDAIDRRFDMVDQRFEAVDQRFDRIETDIVELRREMRAGFDGLQTTLNRIGGGLLIGLSGVIVAVILQGG